MHFPRLPLHLLLASLLTASGLAATYRVGPGRTYATLISVSSRLRAGDVVEVDGDVTYAGQITFRNHGTAAAQITIRGLATNGNRPVLATAGGVAGGSVVRFWGNHYVFENFEITGGGEAAIGRGIHVVADDVTIRDCAVHDVPGQGIHGSDSAGSLTLDHVEVYRCGEGGFEHQIYVATDNAAYPQAVFRMQFCHVHDGAGGNNVKSRAGRTELYYNWIEGAAYYECELIGADPTAQTAGANVREDADVVGNVFVRTVRSPANVALARLGTDGLGASWGRYRFAFNTFVFEAAVAGTPTVFRMEDAVGSLELHNNVFDRAGGLLRVAGGSYASALKAGTNNWVPPGTAGLGAACTGTLTGAAPGFRAAASWDLTPAGGGALFDAGSAAMPGPAGAQFPSPLLVPLFHPPVRGGAVAPRPVAGVPDIGAFEAVGDGRANTPPAAGDDTATVTVATAVEIDLLANDSDAEGDPLTLASVAAPAQGSATIAGNRLVFTPGSAFPGETTLLYRVSDGRATSTARVTIRNPFLALAGLFDGAIGGPEGLRGLSGSVLLKVGTSGAFSGKARIGSRTVNVRGAFDATGHAALTVALTDGTVFTFTLQLALDGPPVLSGTVGDGSSTVGLSMERVPFSKANPAPQTGSYTLLLPAPATTAPGGQGWAVLTMNYLGGVRCIAQLGDGAAFSCGSYLHADATLALYARLYGKTGGGIAGTLLFRAQPGTGDCDGTLDWWKPPQTTAVPYRGGFAVTLPVLGARYAAGAWSAANAGIVLTGGALPAPLAHALAFSPTGGTAVLDAGADALALTLAPSSGLLSGSFRHPLTGLAVKLRGVIFAPLTRGAGVFTAAATAGSFEIAPQ